MLDTAQLVKAQVDMCNVLSDIAIAQNLQKPQDEFKSNGSHVVEEVCVLLRDIVTHCFLCKLKRTQGF